ncbi:MAG: phosphonate metabolism protein/1,5-bisphosphokinase (PRPP-forming) PhnN [Chromatiales bacterium]|jgi:ribose 1,5-bisphosphokinase
MAELFYVVGASGVGKDSLLNYARSQLQFDTSVIFAHRYITRSQDAGGENHVVLSEAEFASRMGRGCFAMQWYSHNTWYGIGVEIDQWLSKGFNVVVNGSRGYLDEAARNYPELTPVLITAELELLRRRLQNRGRESVDQIEQRLHSAQRLDQEIKHPRLHRIANNGILAQAGEQLLQLIQRETSQICA